MESAHEVLLEALRSHENPPDLNKVTYDEGHDLLTVHLRRSGSSAIIATLFLIALP